MLAHATAGCIARYGRREVRVLDPLTGEQLWVISGVSPQTTVFGDDRDLYFVEGDGSVRVLRGTDGTDVDVPGLDEIVRKAVVWRPHEAIVVDNGTVETSLLGVRRSKLTVQSVDPHTAALHWSLDFEDRSRLSLLNDSTLLVLESTGELQLADLETGKAAHLGALPEEMVDSQVTAVADSEFVYLLVDHLPNQNWSYLSGPPVIRVNGTVFAMRRDGTGLAWQHRVENQNLLLVQFEHAPLMVFLSSQQQLVEDLRFSYFKVRLLAIDKQTGRTVAELDQPMSGSGGFYQADLDMDGRSFDIRTHNRRFRIHAVDRTASAEQ